MLCYNIIYIKNFNLIIVDHIITGIDIGSNSIKLAVGQKGADGYVNIIGGVEVSSDGINKGMVSSLEDAVSCVSRLIEQAEKMIGVQIESVYLGLAGPHIISQNSHGVVAVAKAEGEVRQDDVDRVLSSAQAVASPHNYEIMHVLPQEFIIDGQRGIKDAVGMTGVRLEVEAHIIQGLISQNKNLTTAIYRTGVDINDYIFSVLGTAEAVLTKKQKDLGVCLVNIGQSITTLVVYEDNNILTTSVLQIGSRHITSDLAIGLKTNIDIAEAIKIKYGIEDEKSLEKKDFLNLSDFDSNNQDKISKKEIKNIIEARVEEMFTMIDKELKKINRNAKLPAGIILTGGGAKLSGIINVAKKICKLPAEIGAVQNVNSIIDKTSDPAFSTAIGLVLFGSKYEDEEFGNKGRGYKKGGNPFKFIKDMFGKFLPN